MTLDESQERAALVGPFALLAHFPQSMATRAYRAVIGGLSGTRLQRERGGTEVLDGLRGIAILAVVIYHSWLFSWLTPAFAPFGLALPLDVPARTGYLGVELFFVISGFVLFYPHARHAVRGTPVPALGSFVRRRALKIVPSYAIALVATAAVAGASLASPADLLGLARHALFVHNFWPDRFGAQNSVFWSLAIEVQFYLVFPALAVVFRRAPFAAAAAMIASALAYRYAVAGCCLQVESVTRQLPAFLDVFACGMLAAYAVARGPGGLLRLRHAGTLATLVAIALAAVAFALLHGASDVTYDAGGRERWLLPNRTAFAATVAAFAVASAFASPWWRAIVANRALAGLSIVSYNLYLWHTLVMIWLWKHDVPHAATLDPHDDPQWKVPYLVLGWTLSLAIATAVTYFIERPLLGLVKPQTFAFDWRALGRARVRRAAPGATSETRT